MIVKNIVEKNTPVQIWLFLIENLLMMIAAKTNVGINPTERIALNENVGYAATPVL